MARTRSEARSSCRLNSERDDARAKLEQELRDTAKTIADTLPESEGRAVGPLFADLFSALPGVEAPASLREAAKGVATAREDADARQTFFALGVKLWTRLVEADAMEQGRARVLAERLAPCAELPALLFFLERDAADHGLVEGEAVFAHELDRRFPSFRRGRGHAAIERPLLDALGATPESKPRLQLELHPNGRLASLRVAAEGGPSLTLSAGGGAGRFTHTGTRGGYGFHVDERYAEGRVHTTLNSPWHDGCESSEAKEWVCWVLECLGSIVAEAERNPSPRRKR
jgi:hypothetical protein